MQTDLTLEVLKDLIATKLNLVRPIDMLESDRGPSIEEMAQFKQTKIIHFRCLKRGEILASGQPSSNDCDCLVNSSVHGETLNLNLKQL